MDIAADCLTMNRRCRRSCRMYQLCFLRWPAVATLARAWERVGYQSIRISAKKKLPVSTCPRGAEDDALRTGSRWLSIRGSTPGWHPCCRETSNYLLHSVATDDRPHPCSQSISLFAVKNQGSSTHANPKERNRPHWRRPASQCDVGKIGQDDSSGQGRFSLRSSSKKHGDLQCFIAATPF